MIIFPSSLLAMPQGITMDFLLHGTAQSKKREKSKHWGGGEDKSFDC